MVTMAEGVCGILLASGSGTRFGSDKLMHVLSEGGEPIAAHAARHLAQAIPGSVAVVRAGNSALARMLRARGMRIAVCRDASEGMGRTLAAGVRASSNASGWVVALADMPFVQVDTIARIAAAVKDGAVIAAPRYLGQRGHPVGLARRFREDLEALQGDAGARGIVTAHPEWITLIDVDDPGVIQDIDTPADLPKK